MDLMNQLFIELPDLFAIIDVIPVDTILTEGGIPLPRSVNYPTITLITFQMDSIPYKCETSNFLYPNVAKSKFPLFKDPFVLFCIIMTDLFPQLLKLLTHIESCQNTRVLYQSSISNTNLY